MSASHNFGNRNDKTRSSLKQSSFSSEETLSFSNFKVSFLDRKVPLLLCITVIILVALIGVSAYAIYVTLFYHGYISVLKEPEVAIGFGVIKGFISKDIVQFLGIPYALPPVAARRFQKPVELTTNDLYSEAWNISPNQHERIFEAHSYRNVCMQLLPISDEVVGSEDCLYLNIFAPQSHKPEELHPVIFIISGFFFIYGGSSNGSTFFHQPDPETVNNLNAIHVTFNYRLGPFGFLTHPSSKVANIGVRDQIAALRWVRTNIRYFGGDPLRITIFAYGSGATTSLALLGSPLAQNLFEKAWISAPALRNPEITLDSAINASKDVFTCEQSECTQPGEDILRLWNWTVVEPWIEQFFTLPSALNTYCLLGLPCQGGILVIDDEIISNSSWKSPLSPIPIVLGQNAQEAEVYPFPNTVHLWTSASMSNYIQNILGANSSEFRMVKDFYLSNNKAELDMSKNYSSAEYSIVSKFSEIVTDIRLTCPLQSYAQSLRRAQPIQRYYIRSKHAHFNPYGFDSFVSSAFHGWDAFLLFRIYHHHPDYVYEVGGDPSLDKALQKLSENFRTSLKHFIWHGTLFPGKKNTLLTIFDNEIIFSTSVDNLSMCREWNALLEESPYLYAWQA